MNFLFVIQASMMQSIERYMKQAIVDRNPAVSSAALVSSLVGEALVSFKNDQVFSLSFSFLSPFLSGL